MFVNIYFFKFRVPPCTRVLAFMQSLNTYWEMIIQVYNQTWGQFNSGIGIDYLKKNGIELELRNFELELKFPTKN